MSITVVNLNSSIANLKKDADKSEINDEIFDIILIPDETNDTEDTSNLAFTWDVIEFFEKSMII